MYLPHSCISYITIQLYCVALIVEYSDSAHTSVKLFEIISIFVLHSRINNFRETGLLAHWIDRWVPKGALGKQKAETGATKATLDDIQGALYVLLMGLAAGTLALVAEYVIKYYLIAVARMRKKRKKGSRREYKK